ncbi:uncharacterized protein RHOBADRAFT_66256, partial [Rhodotorula graminis WP1]
QRRRVRPHRARLRLARHVVDPAHGLVAADAAPRGDDGVVPAPCTGVQPERRAREAARHARRRLRRAGELDRVGRRRRAVVRRVGGHHCRRERVQQGGQGGAGPVDSAAEDGRHGARRGHARAQPQLGRLQARHAVRRAQGQQEARA